MVVVVADVAAGFVGATSGHTFADCGPLYVHLRSTFSCHTSATNGGLDATDQVSPASRFRHLRVPSFDYAAHESLYTPNSCG